MSRRGNRHGVACIVAIAALPLGACVNSAAQLGQPPPVQLAVAQRTLLVPLVGDPHLADAERVRLAQEAAALGGPEARAVRARILAAVPEDADAVRRALVAAGVDPARITMAISPQVVRRMPSVTLSRSFARTPDCGDAITPGFLGDPSPSLDSVGRCVQASNLAAMLVDPADLVAPPALAPADGAYLLDGVHAWRENRSAALPNAGFDTPDSTASGGTSGSAYGGAGNTASALPAPGAGTGTGASAAAVGNPLLTP